MAVQAALGTLDLSAATLALFERCPLAFSYETLGPQRLEASHGVPDDRSLARATRDAIGAVLRSGRLDPLAASTVIEEALGATALSDGERECAEQWASAAAYFIEHRTGELHWVDELLVMQRVPGVTLWARVDAAISGGKAAPLEVISWAFGRTPARSLAELRAAPATVVARLVAGANETNAARRPIAVTEVDAVAATVRSAVLTDAEVRSGYQRIKDAAASIREALERGSFPARPGAHCPACRYRVSCPAVAAGSDEVPL